MLIRSICTCCSIWLEKMDSRLHQDQLGQIFRFVWQCPTNYWTCSLVIPKNSSFIWLNVLTYPTRPSWVWALLIQSNALDMGTSQSGASDGHFGWQSSMPFRISKLFKASVCWLYCVWHSGPDFVRIYSYVVDINKWFVLPTWALDFSFGNIKQFLCSLTFIALKEILVVIAMLSK